MRSAGIEPAWFLAASSRQCVYRFATSAKSTFRIPVFRSNGLEDQVGLEPTVTCVDGLGIRSLGRWGHKSVMEDPGGFEPLAHGLKVRSISIQV